METERFHINNSKIIINDETDRFVGIKGDVDGIKVHFPLGYQLSENEIEIRQDILNLISILLEFTDKSDGRYSLGNVSEMDKKPLFPISAYLDILSDFLTQKNYYCERQAIYRVGNNGKISWRKTIKKIKPLLNNAGSFVYTHFILRKSAVNDRELITLIHRYCVYESFKKIGWLFTTFLPEKPAIVVNVKLFLNVLENKLAHTFDDRTKHLMLSMITILKYIESNPHTTQFSFGVEKYDHIWECLVDSSFGVLEKEKYFSKVSWRLQLNNKTVSTHIMPDSIMLLDGDVYVLDAKYYKYGVTGKTSDLPMSESVVKQIAYGEYAQKIKDSIGYGTTVYNAFIMPYNMNNNIFGFGKPIESIGYAYSDWKDGKNDYEHIVGIVIDTKYLMTHYNSKIKSDILNLARIIETALKMSHIGHGIDGSD